MIGIDILDLPATTVSIKYQFSSNPRYSLNVNGGFTVNYANNIDLIGYWTTSHTDDMNGGYDKEIEKGVFLKLGGQFNFRKSLLDNNYFYIGAYQTNTWINEKGIQEYYVYAEQEYKDVEHSKYLIGIATTLGYHFRVQKRLQFDLGLQLSELFNDNGELFGHENYVPGIGFHAYNRGKQIFHRFYFNICYEFGKKSCNMTD